MYSEKDTKFCEISTVDLTGSTWRFSQNFVAFSEYMNFKKVDNLRARGKRNHKFRAQGQSETKI